MVTRFLAVLGIAAAVFALVADPGEAQNYPTRPVTVIVPFAAGGPTDVVARIVGDHMGRTLGQQVIVENVVGAGGTTGISKGAAATPDGYTIMMGHMGTHGAAPALYKNLKYDPTKDFAPIGIAAGTPILVVARIDFPPKTLQATSTARRCPFCCGRSHWATASLSACATTSRMRSRYSTRTARRAAAPA